MSRVEFFLLLFFNYAETWWLKPMQILCWFEMVEHGCKSLKTIF